MTLLAALILSQTATAPPEAPSAGPLLTEMFAKTFATTRRSVRITTVQTASSAKVTTVTDLQFEKDSSKLYIRQSRDGSEAGKCLVVSDGTKFSYDRPERALGRDRYLEAVTQNGIVQSVNDLYIASKSSLVELSAPLDILLASRIDIQALRMTWGRFTRGQDVKLGDKNLRRAVGKFRLTAGGPLVGDVIMDIDDDGELVRYITTQNITVPEAQGQVFEVLTVSTIEPTPYDEKRYSVE